MNKIYKVIWSKAKHTYVVASEIAKGHTKGETTGRGLKKLAAAMLVAAALLSPNFVWAADMVKVDESASDTAVEVYTKKGTDTQVNAAKTYTYRKVAAEEHAREAADTEIKQAMTDQKTSTALHVSKDGNLIVGTKENQLVKNMKINGKLTSGSLSTGDITSSGDVTVAGKMAADGVTDETTKDGTYIKQNNTVGNNLVSLDTQVKANADAIAEKANATDVYTKAETDQKVDAANTYTYRKVAAEEKAREAADTEIKQAMTDQKTSTALHVSKDGNLIVGTKENQLVKNMKINGKLTSGSLSTGDITSSGDVTVAGKMAADGVTDETTKDGTYIKQNNTVGNNLVSLDTQVKANADAIAEKANATDVYTKAETDQKVDAANTYTYRKVAAEEKVREAADTELNERITGMSRILCF